MLFLPLCDINELGEVIGPFARLHYRSASSPFSARRHQLQNIEE